MKKTLKGLSAILMTSVLAVSASAVVTPTFAGAYNITMSSTENHTYTAYQIFDGELSESGGTKTLSNITWGKNINGVALLTALQGSSAFGSTNPFTGKTIAAEVADVIDAWNDTTDTAQIKAFAKLAANNLNTTAGVSGTPTITIADADAGYYLIKDTTASASMPDGGTYSDFMLEVVSNVTVAAKDETVTSDKRVTDANDSTGTTEGNKTTADYDIGDSVPYVLSFTLPTKYAEYSKYPITFTDTMCAGLTYNGDAKIYYGAADTTGEAISFTGTDIATTATEYPGGKKYTATIDDLKASQAAATSGSALASLAAGSVIRIEYTAKLNANATIGSAGNKNKYNVTFANDPTWFDDGAGGTQPDTPPTGTTPEKVNTVFTYKLVVNKVKSDNTALTGADFDLEKWIKNDSGTETYNSEKGNWVSVTEINTGTGAVNPTKTGSTAGSTFEFKGIDDGIYKLHEATTPDGYNTIDDIIFTVAPIADGDLPDNITLGSATFSCSDSEGSISGNVVNKTGVTLPTTGGVGTTIFYIIGGLMISGALVLLIVKKRMSIKEK
ncbi:MAG: isopeptide-forming domain-containing fimbrial protein [Ruminococcus sp.]|nr:isopeptide-forming domain-containing fimbrial protein [Ruminococcus sp.]